MGGEGHILDMINRMKYNEMIRKSRRSRYQKVKETYLKIHLKSNPKLLEKKMSNEELILFRKKLKRELMLDRLKSILAATISIFIVGGLIYIIINQLE
ncbi:MAG: hypothetical protein K9H64_20455 [Bacteroidales bacterium]|nr:hypothetical protein [Bacteroidales bacterium]MCF8458421.1 hypothetical protein [Bacteroidales bacterium]